jgi:hypothetical protein
MRKSQRIAVHPSRRLVLSRLHSTFSDPQNLRKSEQDWRILALSLTLGM